MVSMMIARSRVTVSAGTESASTATGFIAYSAVAGAVGAGGLGDLAIRYGYYRFETSVMIWCVIIMFILVQLAQYLGDWLVRRSDKR